MSNHRTSLRYRALLFLLSPAALLYTLYRSLKDGGWRYFFQRWGFSYPRTTLPSVLVHCASVGEFIAARPLLDRLNHTDTGFRLVISTNTPTAAKLVSGLPHEQFTHVYLPLDYSFAVKRFLSRICPSCVLILETEIWPNLILQAARKNITTAIVNGRLSSKTLQAKRMLRNEYRSSLRNLTAILARSDEDRLRFLDLGAEQQTTFNAGNLKFAAAQTDKKTRPTHIQRPYFLAVSTHEDEELQLLEHMSLLKENNCLLVLAPRYPERGKALYQQLRQRNFTAALRSQQDSITELTEIYVVDTLGELDSYLNEAFLVFVGGSLVPRGGHNILEPAGFGKCAIVGPHMDNFSRETKELLDAEGIVQVSDNRELGTQLARLVHDQCMRDRLGMNALRLVKQKALILEHYMKFLQSILEQH